MDNQEWLDKIEQEMNGEVSPVREENADVRQVDLNMTILTIPGTHEHVIRIEEKTRTLEFKMPCNMLDLFLQDAAQLVMTLELMKQLDEADERNNDEDTSD